MTDTKQNLEAEPVSAVVWDAPVRIVHWILAALLPVLWWTAENNHLSWHMLLGKIMMGMLLFRLLWGLFGSVTARFRYFVKGPFAVLAHLRANKGDKAQEWIGHNPLGAWSVVAMLGLLLVQVALGLVAGDPDDGVTGPSNHLVKYATASAATEWHEILFNVIVALVTLHVAAIAYYLATKRVNLVRPMITGRMTLPAPVAQPPIGSAKRAVLCAAVAIGIAWWLGSGAPIATT